MNQQAIKLYLQNNKTVAIGVPFIVCILLLDLLVLRPGREAKQREAAGQVAQQQQQQSGRPAAPSKPATPSAPKVEIGKVAPPAPLATPSYPQLSEKIESRFAANRVYPYDGSRNVFLWPDNVSRYAEIEAKDNIVERPDITYHGFFTLGNDKVAILRLANELLLTRLGSTLKKTSFSLAAVMPDKIIISDTSEALRDFEVTLSEQPKDK